MLIIFLFRDSFLPLQKPNQFIMLIKTLKFRDCTFQDVSVPRFLNGNSGPVIADCNIGKTDCIRWDKSKMESYLNEWISEFCESQRQYYQSSGNVLNPAKTALNVMSVIEFEEINIYTKF